MANLDNIKKDFSLLSQEEKIELIRRVRQSRASPAKKADKKDEAKVEELDLGSLQDLLLLLGNGKK